MKYQPWTETMRQCGFDPMRNKFPQMDCRICETRNPLVFYAPKPTHGRQGAPWVCVCYDCAEKRMGWIDKRTGGLRDDVSL